MKPLAEATSIPEVAVFKGFEDDELWNVPGYQRNLPHWRLEGASYFVTFRLADSIPSEVARGWKENREAWLRSHGIEPAWEKQDGERFRVALLQLGEGDLEAFRKQQGRQFFVELDKCHGCCVLREAHALVLETLEHFHGSRLWLGDCVVMPNHVHVIAQPFPGIKLEEWLYSVKRFSATRIAKAFPNAKMREGHFWQTESFDRVIRDREELGKTREYIKRNPRKLKAGTFSYRRMAWLDT